MKRLLGILVITILLLLIAVYSLKNHLAKYAINRELSEMGINAEIGRIDLDIRQTTIQVDNLTIFSPPGFEEKVMAEIPDLYVDFSLDQVLKKEWHFAEIRLNVSKLNIEKTRDGRINVEEIKADTGNQPAATNGYQIDTLVLSLGHVKALDYSGGTTPKILETDMEMKNKVFHNVTDMEEIADIIIRKIASEHLFLSLGLAAGDMAKMGVQTVGVIGKGAGELAGAIIPFGHEEKTKNETEEVPEIETQPEEVTETETQPKEAPVQVPVMNIQPAEHQSKE